MNKYRLFLSFSLACFFLQTQLFAMQDPDLKLICEAATRVQAKQDILNKESVYLSNSIIEADSLIQVILDPKTTPTTVNFLRAVYGQATEQELSTLYREAQNKKEIANIILGGHTKFRADAPTAHQSLLRLSGLMSNVKITDDMATVKYGKLVVPPTPDSELKKARKAAQDSADRKSMGLNINPDLAAASVFPQPLFVEQDENDVNNQAGAAAAAVQPLVEQGAVGKDGKK